MNGPRPADAANRLIVGNSSSMKRVRRWIRLFARHEHPVCITGEPGTGKELVARAIHECSGRATFVALNCATIPNELAASTLFGHVKGAFTGAEESVQGAFRKAGGGSLFLDEVGDLASAVQPMLLRAIDPGEATPVGSAASYEVHARVLSATNRDPKELRQDLFDRLGTLHIDVPPLRKRRDDIADLTIHMLADKQIERPALRILQRYDFPGNVRELQTLLRRAYVFAGDGVIKERHIQEAFRMADVARNAQPQEEVSERFTLSRVIRWNDMERRYAAWALAQYSGNRTLAARHLGIDRKTLRRKLRSADEDGRVGRSSPPAG